MDRNEVEKLANDLGFPVLKLDVPGWLHFANEKDERLLLNKNNGRLIYYRKPDDARLTLSNDIRDCYVEDLPGQLNSLRQALENKES